MSETIDIRRDGDEWIMVDGSARIRITQPGAGTVARFVEHWDDKSPRNLAPLDRGRTAVRPLDNKNV